MSRWFIEHRQTYIAGMLAAFGQVNRAALAAKFQISAAQASADLQFYLKNNPDALIYDDRAKAYVVNRS